jgi:hypothetical protein
VRPLRLRQETPKHIRYKFDILHVATCTRYNRFGKTSQCDDVAAKPQGPTDIGDFPPLVMSQSIQERVKKLREEIAKLNEANRIYAVSPKYGSAQSDNERRFQRLLEIVDKLNSMTDWKKI